MVQRKVATNLAPQADHQHKAEIQHQDLKSNKAADLKKKKMKRSGSIKRHKHPGKPPPPPEKAATTPNYMKPTTSSDARKEQSQSQVSTRNPNTSPCSSSLRRKNSESSKLSLSSGKKATKTLLARTLTKNPSFKPVRASVRCSTVVLCEDLDAQRATCSSTLKDCKFPAYLSLNPGGSESEGTSAVKVCPYTYCSLNGHHHAPVPPLKSFLMSRRRMIKTQRSFKVGCLSPRRVKPVGDDFLVEKESEDFVVEIYSKEKEDTADGAVVDETAEDQEERVGEMLSDAPICDDFDIYESIDRNRDDESNQEAKIDEEISPPLSVEEERSLEFSTELSEESQADVDFDEFEDSEGSDMDWEKGDHSALNLDHDYDFSPATEDIEPDSEADCTIKNEFVIKSDGKDWCLDEFWGDEVSQESYAESLNSDAFSSSHDGESSDSDNRLQSSSSMESPAPLEGQEEESEQACVEENLVVSETSSSNLNQQSLANEDSISVTEDQESNLENTKEDIVTLSSVDSGEEPHSDGTKLQSTEGEMEDGDLARLTAKSKKPIEDIDELGSFNLRGPNFLPLEPGPEAEKVDLKHQDLDEKKNAEEWMVDYALRQVVTKLGPARKRKVALLVEAFEKVMPITKCDFQLRHGSALDQARPVQACN